MTVSRSIQLNAQFEMSAETCLTKSRDELNAVLSPSHQNQHIFVCKLCQQLGSSKNVCQSTRKLPNRRENFPIALIVTQGYVIAILLTSKAVFVD